MRKQIHKGFLDWNKNESSPGGSLGGKSYNQTARAVGTQPIHLLATHAILGRLINISEVQFLVLKMCIKIHGVPETMA